MKTVASLQTCLASLGREEPNKGPRIGHCIGLIGVPRANIYVCIYIYIYVGRLSLVVSFVSRKEGNGGRGINFKQWFRWSMSIGRFIPAVICRPLYVCRCISAVIYRPSYICLYISAITYRLLYTRNITCRNISCNMMPCHIIPCQNILLHNLPCRACRNIPCHNIPCRNLPCRDIPCCTRLP